MAGGFVLVEIAGECGGATRTGLPLAMAVGNDTEIAKYLYDVRS